MGKNVTEKSDIGGAKARPRRRYLRAGALAGLMAVGLGSMAGMALFNGNAKPNRDMQWYMKAGAVEVAAPSAGEGYAETGDAQGDDIAFALADMEGASASLKAAEAIVGELDVGEAAEPAGDEGAEALDEPTAEEGSESEEATQSPEAASGAEEAGAPETAAAPEAEAVVEDDAAEAEPEYEIPDGPVTLTITAAGDCTFGGQDGAKGRRRFVQYAKDYGYDYFFDGVRSIFESDDLTIVNLEGPLTTIPKPAKNNKFLFHGDPEYVNILTGSSVELCNVANNHSQDYGVDGLKETAEVLDAAGIGYCGYTQVYYTTIKGVRVGAMGFTWWEGDRKKISAAVAEARQNCDLLIVSMHWGTEYEYEQSYLQEDLGRAIIDAGADLVIGTHPHVFQGIEKYKGKYIVYSLGNFCFAGNANPADKRCLIFQQTFSFTPGMGIAQAGIMDEGINIIPTSISSKKELNDFQPTVMDATAGAKVLKSVANHSTNLSFEDTLWMKDNYMVQNGLIGGEEAAAEEEAAGEAASQT